MSSKVSYKGWEELETMLENVADKTESICKMMVYVGAGTVADSIKSSLSSKVSEDASGDLAKHLNVRDIKSDASAKVFTKVAFDDYIEKGDNKTASAIIAAVLESGRSDQPDPPGTEKNKWGHQLRGRKATHFFSEAVAASRGQAQTKMAEKFNTIIDNFNKGAD